MAGRRPSGSRPPIANELGASQCPRTPGRMASASVVNGDSARNVRWPSRCGARRARGTPCQGRARTHRDAGQGSRRPVSPRPVHRRSSRTPRTASLSRVPMPQDHSECWVVSNVAVSGAESLPSAVGWSTAGRERRCRVARRAENAYDVANPRAEETCAFKKMSRALKAANVANGPTGNACRQESNVVRNPCHRKSNADGSIRRCREAVVTA